MKMDNYYVITPAARDYHKFAVAEIQRISNKPETVGLSWIKLDNP
jgi:hypothetical protein